MNEKLIDLVIRTISKTYTLHIEMCYKGEESYEKKYIFQNVI